MHALVKISRDLARAVDRLTFEPPVRFVYNPLDYARVPHERYLTKYGGGTKEAVLLGMNPGPFGMAQTGVPFGDVAMVRDFLGVEGKVGEPEEAHPKRPVRGFDCHRSEVSGTRLWGWVRDRFGTPEAFFERFFIANYCPLVFLEESGRNRTPDKLRASEREALTEACDLALGRVVDALAPEVVIGVGKYAEGRARAALEGRDVKIGSVLHPSPASPKANRGWAEQADEELRALGVRL